MTSTLAILLLLAAPDTLHANDGSQDPPKLWIVASIWGLTGLPAGGPEWPLDEKLRRVAAAGGFDAVDRFHVGEAAEREALELNEMARRHGLRQGLHTRVDRIDQIAPAVRLAKRIGTPYVDVMTGPYFMKEGETVALLRDATKAFRAERIAMFLQTHRGLVTQDLLRTVGYARRLPELRFALDLSHYVVAGDLGGDFPPAAAQAFAALAARTGMLDGRVSNGEQVQIDVGPEAVTPPAARFAVVWKATMVSWLRRADKGDVFVFRTELGPPAYAIRDLDGRELGDRWQQTLVLRALAERLFDEAVAETGIGKRHAAGR